MAKKDAGEGRLDRETRQCVLSLLACGLDLACNILQEMGHVWIRSAEMVGGYRG